MDLKYTRDDRRFLQSIRIDHEEPMEGAVDIITGFTQSLPDNVLIPHWMVRDIIKEFGELTSKTYWAYLMKFGNGDKRTV